MRAGRKQIVVRCRTQNGWMGVTRLLFVIPLVLSLAPSAFAHPQKGAAVGFLTGFRHPISGLDHALW